MSKSTVTIDDLLEERANLCDALRQASKALYVCNTLMLNNAKLLDSLTSWQQWHEANKLATSALTVIDTALKE